MLVRFLVLLFFCSFSVFSSAEAEKLYSSGEPEDLHLGLHLSLVSRDRVSKIFINDNKFLLVDLDNTDVKVVKDIATGLNHLNVFVAYRLYSGDVRKSGLSRLYVQCPITRTTYADHSEVLTECLVEGTMVPTSFKVNLVTLKEELASPGYYKFFKWPEGETPALSSNFSLQGKVTQQKDIELLYTRARISYQRYKLAEGNRAHLLEMYGITE